MLEITFFYNEIMIYSINEKRKIETIDIIAYRVLK